MLVSLFELQHPWVISLPAITTGMMGSKLETKVELATSAPFEIVSVHWGRNDIAQIDFIKILKQKKEIKISNKG